MQNPMSLPLEEQPLNAEDAEDAEVRREYKTAVSVLMREG